MSRACDAAVGWGLLALIAFTPLAFGTVEPWSTALMEWGIATLALVFAIGRVASPARPAAVRAAGLGPVLIPVALFILLAVAQTVALPIDWVKRLAPGSARLQASAAEALDEAPRAERPPEARLPDVSPDRASVSVEPRHTWDRVILLISLAVLFVLIVLWAQERRKVFFLARTIVGVGFIISVSGLIQLLTWNGRIFWLRRVPGSPGATPRGFGPFVNHDHFAGYVGMVLPLAIALVFVFLDRGRGGAGAGVRPPGARGAAPEQALSKGILALFVAVILIVALFFSLSRAGIASSLIAGGLLIILLTRQTARRGLTWGIVAAVPIGVALLIAWIGAGEVRSALGSVRDLGSEASFRMRATIWRAVAKELPSHLWLGAGFGTFEESFAPVTPRGSAARWDRAHNDYLQLVWETGLAGAALFVSGLVMFGRRYWWPAIRGGIDPIRPALAAALLAIALHSFVDFNLQIGANAFLCSVVAGLLVATARPEPGGGPALAEAGPLRENDVARD